MKKALILLLILPLFLNSQNNFKVEDDILKWQKVFTDSTSINNLYKSLKLKSTEANLENNLITFSNDFDSENLKPHGFKSGSFPTYIQLGGDFNGVVEFKDNRYRATVISIKVVNALDPSLKFNLSEFNIKRGEIKQKKHHLKVLEMLDKYFTSYFTISKNSDW